MSKRILSVSYDVMLLATRRMLLETRGYSVTNAWGFTASLAHCKSGGFDLFILGHSIPTSDKEELIRTFKEACPAPVLSLERVGEERVQADYHAAPDNPEQLLSTVEHIFEGLPPGGRLRPTGVRLPN